MYSPVFKACVCFFVEAENEKDVQNILSEAIESLRFNPKILNWVGKDIDLEVENGEVVVQFKENLS